jgi:hypothetical protein
VDDRDDAPLARAPEPEDVARVCRALNDDAEVRYVLIGGFAVIVHGGGRFTKDLALLDDPPENIARVKRALAILPDNAVADVANSDVQSYQVVRVVDEIVIDLMGRACGLSYADVVRDAESLDLLGVKVPVASPATLIRTKDTLRPQDAIDRAFLEGVLRGRA